MLCFVVIANPYPIIFDDAPNASQLTFYGKGNYKNYGCHYAPVIPYGNEKTTADYRPPNIGMHSTRET